MIASFTFHRAGMYEVTLNVTDTAGNFGIDILNVIVQDTEPPVARAGSDIVVEQHEIVIFNASLSTDNVAILTYTWTFIYDNTQITLSGRIVEFVFHNAGDYKITLNVTDAAGNFGIDELNVTVIDIEPPIANAGSDIIISLYGTAIFNASLSKDNVGIVNYTWTFIYDDEQIILYGMCTSFTFETIGIYTITLNVTDAAGNFGIDTVNVTVIDTTPPDISHSPIKEWVEGTPITVVAVVTDNVAVKDVILYYRLGGDAEYKSIKMVQEKGKNVWSVVIPSAEVKGDALDYYIIAYDTFGNIAEYPSDGEKKPIRIDLKKAFVLPIEFLIAFGIIGVCMIVFTISKIRMHKRMQKKKKFK
jgi:PKD repeat protein